jgi:hypothetical protein
MKKSMLFISVIALVVGMFAPAAVAEEEMPSDNPILLAPFPGGNALNECARLTAVTGTSYLYSYKIDNWDGNMDGDYVATFPDGHSNTITISGSNDKTFDWTATNSIGGVLVKGGPNANAYVYVPQAFSDTGLIAPDNLGGNQADISHVTFCWNPDGTNEFEGCTPGFWRNVTRPSERAWGMTGYERTDVVFGDKSLQQHLNTTGGLLDQLNFHTAAALLNASHPGIDYPYTKAEILALYDAAIASGDYEPLKDLFDAANNLGSDVC